MQRNGKNASKGPKPGPRRPKPAGAGSVTVMGALKQQVAAPSAYGGNGKTMFRVGPSRFSGKYRDAICVEGVDWLGPVTVGATETAGTTYLEWYMNPGEFAQSRMAAFGSLYEKFLFEELQFDYMPQQPSSQKGSIILAYDRDISDATPSPGPTGVRQFLAYEDSVYGNVWTPKSLVAKLEAPETGFYTNQAIGGDDRLAYQGQLYVACMEPTALSAGVVLGDIIVRYKLHLYVPQLEQQVVTGNVQNTGGTLPTAADALKQFVTGTAGQSASANTNPEFIPTLQSNGIAGAKLAEGLYRVTQAISQNGAGAITWAAPTLAALEPQIAPAPQPLIQQVAQTNTTASGQQATNDYLLSVPRGGGLFTQTLSVASGIAAGAAAYMKAQKVGPYSASLSSYF